MRQVASHSWFRTSRCCAIASILLTAAATPALAGKVYRCGNVFQDQPCPEVKIAAVTPTPERSGASIRDVTCAASSREAGRGDCRSAAPREPVSEAKH